MNLFLLGQVWSYRVIQLKCGVVLLNMFTFHVDLILHVHFNIIFTSSQAATKFQGSRPSSDQTLDNPQSLIPTNPKAPTKLRLPSFRWNVKIVLSIEFLGFVYGFEEDLTKGLSFFLDWKCQGFARSSNFEEQLARNQVRIYISSTFDRCSSDYTLDYFFCLRDCFPLFEFLVGFRQ